VVIRAVVLAALFASACGTFEEPSIVLDLRVIAMRTDIGPLPTKADQVIDVDLSEQPQIGDLLSQLQTTNVTAWVADPGGEETDPLLWSMTLCLPDEDGRCDRSEPHLEFGAGEIDDPEGSAVFQRPFASILPSDARTGTTIAAMLLDAIQGDPVSAVGGVDLIIELRIGRAAESRDHDVYATKKLKISPRIPIQRAANTNPNISGIETAIDGVEAVPGFASGNGVSVHCADPMYQAARASVSPGDIVTLFPNESSDTREDYAVPGLDGATIILKEAVSYQWLATYGSWSDETTGGGHDLLGNQSLLGSDWTAPVLGGRTVPLDVSLWMIQRDERFGVTPLEMCITVFP
jgi:hypothetical protein